MYSDGARADGAVDALDAYITRVLHDDYAPALPPVLDRSDMPAYILAGRLAGLRPGADEPALATLTRLHARLATATPPAHPRARRPAWLLVAAVVPWVLVLALGATLALSQHSQPAPRLVAVAVDGPRGLHGPHGRLAFVPDGTTAFLTLTRLPHLAAGHTYVCWLARAGQVTRACAFHLIEPDDAMVLVHAPRPLGGYARLDVTDEGVRGAERPTQVALASGQLP